MTASAPARSACWEIAMASRVEFDPAPATTCTRPRTRSTVRCTTSPCSSWLSVGLSPVVPHGTTPATPPATCFSSSASKASQSIDCAASSRNGVTSAVYVPSKRSAMRCEVSLGASRIKHGPELVARQLRQEVVPGPHVVEPARVGVLYVPGLDELAETPEAMQVRPDPRLRVARDRARLEDERPVARLQQEQLAHHLVERLSAPTGRSEMAPDEPLRVARRVVHVAPRPRRLRPHPHLAVAAGPPRAGARRRLDAGGVPDEVLPERDRLELAVGLREAPEDGLEEERPLEPPVAVELRVVRRDDDGGHRHARGERARLSRPTAHEVLSVLPRAFGGDARLIGLLVGARAGDAKVLEAGHQARSVAGDLAHELGLRQVEADVPVEVAIVRVARVSDVARPHLPARLDVPREEGDAVRARDGRVHAERRPGARVQQAVRVEDREADAGARDLVVEARVVGALREPGPGRRAPDDALESADAELELGADPLGRPGRQARQVAMRGRAGE